MLVVERKGEGGKGGRQPELKAAEMLGVFVSLTTDRGWFGVFRDQLFLTKENFPHALL